MSYDRDSEIERLERERQEYVDRLNEWQRRAEAAEEKCEPLLEIARLAAQAGPYSHKKYMGGEPCEPCSRLDALLRKHTEVREDAD